jgi:hypothetical protein
MKLKHIPSLVKHLPETHKVKKHIDQSVENAYAVTAYDDPVFEVRSSSLPICLPLKLYEYVSGEKKKRDYAFEFYVRIGNAVHELLQHAFPRAKMKGKVFGGWVCEKLKHKKCDWRKNLAVFPGPKCPSCGANVEYEEIELEHKHPTDKKAKITAHCDMVMRFGKKIKPVYIAWEFKSAAEWNVENPHKFLPYKKHIYQLSSYVVMLTDKGLRPAYMVVAYFSRNAARSVEEKPEQEPNTPSNGFGNVKKKVNVRKVSHTFVYKVTDELIASMRELLDYEVEQTRLANIVLKKGAPARKTLAKLVGNRPCKSPTDYKKMMQDSFIMDSCKMAKPSRLGGCYTQDKKAPIYNKILKALKTVRKSP